MRVYRLLGLWLPVLFAAFAGVLPGCREEGRQERLGVLLEEGRGMYDIDYEWRGVRSGFAATTAQVARTYEKTYESSEVVVFRGKGIGIVVVGPHWASLKGDFPAAVLYVQGTDDEVQSILELWSGKTIEGPSRLSPAGKGTAETLLER